MYLHYLDKHEHEPRKLCFQWCCILCVENDIAVACYTFDMHKPIIIIFIDNKVVLLGTVCKYYFSPSHFMSKTSNPWVVKFSWLANAYSRPLLTAGNFDELSRSRWASFLMCDQGSPVGSACKITSICVQRLRFVLPWLPYATLVVPKLIRTFWPRDRKK